MIKMIFNFDSSRSPFDHTIQYILNYNSQSIRMLEASESKLQNDSDSQFQNQSRR